MKTCGAGIVSCSAGIQTEERCVLCACVFGEVRRGKTNMWQEAGASSEQRCTFNEQLSDEWAYSLPIKAGKRPIPERNPPNEREPPATVSSVQQLKALTSQLSSNRLRPLHHCKEPRVSK